MICWRSPQQVWGFLGVMTRFISAVIWMDCKKRLRPMLDQSQAQHTCMSTMAATDPLYAFAGPAP
jgi:hypothetical protein